MKLVATINNTSRRLCLNNVFRSSNRMANKTFHKKSNGWQNITPHYLNRRSKSRTISLALCAFILIYLQLSLVIGQQQRGDEVCETLPSDIHLIKGK